MHHHLPFRPCEARSIMTIIMNHAGDGVGKALVLYEQEMTFALEVRRH
jgi:hypothetical protein